MAKNVNNIIYKVQVDATSGKISIDGVTKSFEQADKAFLKLRNDVEKGLPKATKEVNNLRSASGGATTSVLELGRVVSDAPYGIRGMANNVSQLASNMLFTSQQIDQTTGKVIGLGGVLKDMGKVFMGPLGLLFLIQGAIALLDGFAGVATKAKKSISELTSKTYASSLMARNYVEELENVNTSESRRAVVTQELIKLVPTLTKEDLKYGENLDKVRLKIKSYALAQASRIQIDNLVQENSEVLSAKNELESIKQIDDSKERVERMKKFILETGEEISGFYLGFGQEGLINKGNVDATEEEFERLGSIIDKESKPIIQRINELTKALELDPTKLPEIKPNKRAKAEYFDFKSLEEGRGKIIAEIMKTDEKIALLSAKDKKSRLIIQRDFHLRRLMAVDGANSELIETYKEYYAKLIGIEEEAEITRNSKADLSFGTGGLTPNEIKERQAQILEAKLQTMMEASQAITSFMNAEFQREITIEQNKTNAINNELKERLNNENLSASERKRIQLEISKNDEAMRVKKEKLEKKAFKIQKAANIANALVSTYSGASAAYFNSLANPMNKLLPDGGLVRAKINAGIAAAVGLTNVAMIARQKFQSSSAGAPSAGSLGGGSGSGGNDRSFNFNLAGASRENQLAQTLQGRFDQPLQAYVVGRDITNQQQLDEEITSSASFG